MTTPSAKSPDTQAWTRGPKSAPSAPPGTEGGTVEGAGHPSGQAARPPAATATAPRRSAPSRRTAARRSAPVPDGPPWDEPRRNGPAGGAARDAIGWVKAHGGAGATSLAGLFGGVDVGARWPDPARGEPHRIVLVGRTSARGMRAVSRALDALREEEAPDGLDLLAVVLVADAPGRLPLGLLNRVRVIRSVVHVHRVPWIPAWRLDRLPRALPRQLLTLAELVGAEVYADGVAS